MICQTAREWIPQLLDGELDAAQRQELERHLQTCVNCAEALDRAATLREKVRGDAPYFAAPERLTAQVRAKLKAEHLPKRWIAPAWWKPAAGLAALLLLSIFLWDRYGHRANDEYAAEAVSAHVRALMPGHLIDVPSSDRHTVKPWFNGRLDFSPRVEDLSARGFELKGGRLDYLNGRTVAALVFQRREHVIDLFVSSQPPTGGSRGLTIHGYNVLQWADADGMFYSAVSDLNSPELGTIRLAYQGLLH